MPLRPLQYLAGYINRWRYQWSPYQSAHQRRRRVRRRSLWIRGS